jgi:hypothetical protein
MKFLAGVVLTGMLITGCYANTPVVSTAVPLGTQVVIGINDQGRVALGDSLGGSVEAIEGRLAMRDSAALVVLVSQLHLLRGGQQVWSGERIRIRSEFVSSVAERKFSKSRTAIVSAVAIGAIVIVAKTGLKGLLSGDEGKVPGDSAQSVRIPRP